MAHSLRMLHQTPYQTEGQDRRPPADQKPEVRTPCSLHALREQPAQSAMRDHAGPVVEQAWIEPRLLYDRFGIDAEVAQDRPDLLGDTQLNVAGGSVRLALDWGSVSAELGPLMLVRGGKVLSIAMATSLEVRVPMDTT